MSETKTFARFIKDMADTMPAGEIKDAMHVAAQAVIDNGKNFDIPDSPTTGDLAVVWYAFQSVLGALIEELS